MDGRLPVYSCVQRRAAATRDHCKKTRNRTGAFGYTISAIWAIRPSTSQTSRPPYLKLFIRFHASHVTPSRHGRSLVQGSVAARRCVSTWT